jgi:hypothetical protein
VPSGAGLVCYAADTIGHVYAASEIHGSDPQTMVRKGYPCPLVPHNLPAASSAFAVITWYVDVHNTYVQGLIDPDFGPGQFRVMFLLIFLLSPIHFFDGTDAQGHKLFPLMSRSACYDSTDPGFNIPPSDTAKIKSFLYHRWNDAATIYWAYAPELSLQRIWPLTEGLAYTNPTLMHAGMNRFPLGDLYRWWPEEYAEWELQQDAENARITQWLETGVDPGAVQQRSSGISFRLPVL